MVHSETFRSQGYGTKGYHHFGLVSRAGSSGYFLSYRDFHEASDRLVCQLRHQASWAVFARSSDAMPPTPSQSGVICLLRDGEELILNTQTTLFWTPHQGSTFPPSAASALGIPKEQRDFLGGWGAQGTKRDARVARLRITSMQKMVARMIHRSSRKDNIGETETLLQIEEYMTQKNQFTQKRRRSGVSVVVIFLGSLVFWTAVREVEPTDEVMDLAVDPEPELDVAMAERDERRSMNSHRSDTLGDNPRDRRQQITPPAEHIGLNNCTPASTEALVLAGGPWLNASAVQSSRYCTASGQVLALTTVEGEGGGWAECELRSD